MSNANYTEIVKNGLWKNNAALVQMLGLCPLLAVSASVVNALAMGLATTLVLAFSNLVISLIRHHVSDTIRLPTFIMIIASFVTVIDLLMNAFAYEIYQILGIFIPLIVTNCNVLGRADSFASKNPPIPAFIDGAVMGAGFLFVLFVLAAIRELLGTGALFANMHLLFGDIARNWSIQVFPHYQQFLFAVLPPGAFIILGFLVAGKNSIDARIKARRPVKAPEKSGVERRVRTTGNIV